MHNGLPRLPLVPYARAAAAALVLAAFLPVACSPKPASQKTGGPKQETEILFRLMQAAWNQIFTANGSGEYRMAKIVLYRGETETPCGKVSAGVHYCASNRLVSADLSWLEGVQKAQPAVPAYLLARALARHVQHELTVDQLLEKAIAADPSKRDELLIQREMQTECFVGLWRRHHEGQAPSAEDLKSAVRWWAERAGDAAAASVLEDRLRWFDRGFQADEISACNVFAGQW